MRFDPKLLAAPVLAATLALAAGCDTPEAAPEAAATVTETSSSVAAMVNGEPVYVTDVQMEAEAQGLVASGEALEIDSAEFNRILDQLIDVRLLAMEARTRELDQDQQVKLRLDAARDRILGNILIDELVAERVDEAAIRKMYEAQIAIMEMGEEARIRHILTASKDDMDAVVAQLKTGMDFAVLASQKSADEVTRLEGGDLGYMKEEDATPEFARALKTTPTGGVSKPFETQEGWHVIKIEERRPEQPPSLEELRPLILNHLTMMQLDEELKSLRQKAKIDRSTAPQNSPLDVDPFTMAPEGRPQRQPAQEAPKLPATFDAEAPATAAAKAPAAGEATERPAQGPQPSGPVGETRNPAQ
jgi:peptidyl-prolyl cis-trans isomerase C